MTQNANIILLSNSCTWFKSLGYPSMTMPSVPRFKRICCSTSCITMSVRDHLPSRQWRRSRLYSTMPSFLTIIQYLCAANPACCKRLEYIDPLCCFPVRLIYDIVHIISNVILSHTHTLVMFEYKRCIIWSKHAWKRKRFIVNV